jgi:hypothetical protein
VFSTKGPKTLYFGAQVLLKSTDGGLNWAEISPNLTGDERKPGAPAAEGPPSVANAKSRGYGVIYSIAPSPLDAGLIWVGSDTGLVHVTHNGGKNWTKVTPKGLTDWSKVTHIQASHFDAATAYAAVDRHRLDDYQPYLFRTRDSGKTWTRVNTGIEDHSFLNAIREDPSRRGLLFAATEKGVYVSFDDGDHWQPLQRNLPVSSVRDIVVKDDDLVVATHGRGFWILDNLASLRQAAPEVRDGDAWLYRPARAVRILNDVFPGTPLPPEVPQAKNPPSGAVIDFNLKSAGEDCTLDILNSAGDLFRRFTTRDVPAMRQRAPVVSDLWIAPPRRLTCSAGMNRFVWDLRYGPPGVDGEEGPASGPLVRPGQYVVRLTAAGRTLTQPLEVVLDPRSTATAAELQSQFELGMNSVREIELVSGLIAKARTAPVSGQRDARIARLNAALRSLGAVLSVANSADRTPPAQAYALYQATLREIEASGR